MKKPIWRMVIALIILPLFAKADLAIHFLNVGQGDAAIIVCDGESMIIDGGPTSASSLVYSYFRNTLNLSFIDYMIATHPHEDHIGGLAAALNAVPVDLILSPVLEWDTVAWENLAKYADLQGAPMVVPYPGDSLQLGGARVTILHCWPDAWSTNDMSICVRIDYGQTSFVFTGDAEYMAELAMISGELPLKADVLKVAHHGSHSSSMPDFLEMVSPQYAVISCGTNNAYGHPHPETLESLARLNVEVFRTDLEGTIIAVSDGETIYFVTEKDASDEEKFKSPYNSMSMYDNQE